MGLTGREARGENIPAVTPPKITITTQPQKITPEAIQGDPVILSGENFDNGMQVVAGLRGQNSGITVCELGKDPLCELAADKKQITLKALPPLPPPMSLPADLEVRIVANSKVSNTFASFRYLRQPSINITTQPVVQTAQDGMAILIVGAGLNWDSGLNPAPSVSFQWQKQDGAGGWFDLNGATSATLNLSNLNYADDNGDQYRVVVSAEGCEAKLSMPATIKVSAPSARSCQGTMGDFSVSVVRSEAATYQLRLAVINSTPGDLAAVTLVNRNTGTYRNLINGTVLQNNQETVVGSISQSELDTYDTLTVTPFFQNGTWSNQVADRSTDC